MVATHALAGHVTELKSLSMASPRDQGIDTSLGFKSVQLLKEQTLGIGSYGKVCKAKCDDLICAAKLIHETLFDPTAQQLIAPHREHRLPMRRFIQECEFLSTIRHPNIIQYLGIYRDPDTGLPALLMELMDNSLTHFLESAAQLIPYHIQVNICHDITLALSFLHSNNIVHRDLSSNNVLLIGNVRAKVTDFGMARLCDENQQTTHFSYTICPGTDVYMPPEAVQDNPVYTEKIDCFSFGVIVLQTLTRQFPKPGDRRKEIEVSHPGLHTGTVAEVRIPEIERRQNHISRVDPNNKLLHVSLDCLRDRDVERPSAQQLCERVAVLKENPEYGESVRAAVEERSALEQGRGDEREREIRSLRQQHIRQVQGLQQIIQSQLRRLDEKTQTIFQKDEALREKDETIAAGQRQLRRKLNEIGQLEREKDALSERLQRELGHMNHRLEESERVSSQFQRQISELEERLSTTTVSTASTDLDEQQSKDEFKMVWRKGEKAPCDVSTVYNAIADTTTMYIRSADMKVFAFSLSNSVWSQLPDSPTYSCPMVIVKNLLTLVGGNRGSMSMLTNLLFSLTGKGLGGGRVWTKEFPPMPTKRQGTTAFCTKTALIVAGGARGILMYAVRTIEVMNTETLQWSTAADLPKPLCRVPGTICGDHVYVLSLTTYSKSAYTCSISTLIQSCGSKTNSSLSIWTQIPGPPVTDTTCISFQDRLLTIGGRDFANKPTAAVYMYSSATDSWQLVSHMTMPRLLCFAAVVPRSQLVVVGGITNHGKSDSMEIATVE